MLRHKRSTKTLSRQALLREVERRHDLAGLFASCLTDLRESGKVQHSLADIIRFRIMMIAAGYEDGNDAEDLRVATVRHAKPSSAADLLAGATRLWNTLNQWAGTAAYCSVECHHLVDVK